MEWKRTRRGRFGGRVAFVMLDELAVADHEVGALERDRSFRVERGEAHRVG